MNSDLEQAEQAMEDQKKGAYLKQEHFYNHIGLIWLFITFAFMVTGGVGQDVFISILFSVSLLTSVFYIVHSWMLNRRKHQKRD